ncbi:hypothetical protein [Halorhabdus rudnickae]|uniref:hypothetical protein n=1 Tax=Halorhabdus rudnickae TaxID=1775544 RepID=UPI001083F507|nr:hypothetical protein [Halorhabdus rudnickae]
MNDGTHSATRRGVLSAIGLAVAGTITGCSGFTGQRDPTSSDGGQTTGRFSPTVATTADRSGESTTARSATGEHEYDDDRPLSAFQQKLEDRLVPVSSVDVVDKRVQVTYIARSERGHEVAAGIEAIVVSFIQVHRHRWDVEAVDATIMDEHDTDTEMGRWRLEARWVENTLDGEWSRTKLLDRTLSTYHGEPLKQDDDHHGGETDEHHHDEITDHQHE